MSIMGCVFATIYCLVTRYQEQEEGDYGSKSREEEETCKH